VRICDRIGEFPHLLPQLLRDYTELRLTTTSATARRTLPGGLRALDAIHLANRGNLGRRADLPPQLQQENARRGQHPRIARRVTRNAGLTVPGADAEAAKAAPAPDLAELFPGTAASISDEIADDEELETRLPRPRRWPPRRSPARPCPLHFLMSPRTTAWINPAAIHALGLIAGSQRSPK